MPEPVPGPVAFEQFHADIEAGVWEWLPLDERLWAEIDRCFRDLAETLFLRGSDAVHLAGARQHRIKEIYTSDRHMLAACEAFDLLGGNPIRPGS